MEREHAQVSASIGGKSVLLSEPYEAEESGFIGREAELSTLAAAWIGGREAMPLAPLLLGEPGVGKNRLVYELARRTRRPLFIFQGHEDVTAEDLACAVRFSDRDASKMDYVASALVTAMHLGGICFIDEIGKIRPRALALLVSVLDERRYIDSVLLGARVRAHPSFRFVAATNTADLEGNALPEFIRSRTRPVIKVGYPQREEIERIVESRLPRLAEQARPLLDRFWGLWEQLPKHGEDLQSPTPRDAIYIFSLAASLADYDALGGGKAAREATADHPFPIDQSGAASSVGERHLEQAFRELYWDQLDRA
ncbi:MAG: AAA family ATPase [Armatimonadetes bacterium]|nr:AAA family ATPase [Armatimonadota bacterium]